MPFVEWLRALRDADVDTLAIKDELCVSHSAHALRVSISFAARLLSSTNVYVTLADRIKVEEIECYLDEGQITMCAIPRAGVRPLMNSLSIIWATGTAAYPIVHGGCASDPANLMNGRIRFAAVEAKRSFRLLVLKAAAVA